MKKELIMPPNAAVREQTRRSEHEVALGVSDLYKEVQAEEQENKQDRGRAVTASGMARRE